MSARKNGLGSTIETDLPSAEPCGRSSRGGEKEEEEGLFGPDDRSCVRSRPPAANPAIHHAGPASVVVEWDNGRESRGWMGSCRIRWTGEGQNNAGQECEPGSLDLPPPPLTARGGDGRVGEFVVVGYNASHLRRS